MSKIRIIQLLEWKLTDIQNELQNIKNQGFTHIQTGVLQGTKDSGNEWWKLYQPTNFKIGNVQLGSRDDLINLCAEAHKLGLKIIVDIVLRHVATDNYDSTKPHHTVDRELLEYFTHAPEMNEGDRYSETHHATGLPMLDYNNENLQTIYCEFLQDLIDCGVDSFRLDQAKHYTLPFEGGTFYTNVVEKFRDNFLYGECLYCDKYILEEYTKYLKVGTEGRVDNIDNLVAWVESHDSYSLDSLGYTHKMTDDMLVNEYRVLCDNLPNTLFYARPWSDLWKSEDVKYINK